MATGNSFPHKEILATLNTSEEVTSDGLISHSKMNCVVPREDLGRTASAPNFTEPTPSPAAILSSYHILKSEEISRQNPIPVGMVFSPFAALNVNYNF